MDYTEVDLKAYQNITFKASLTITANGQPTNVGDRTFKAQARSKGGGPIAFQFQVSVPDQGQFPGRVDLELSTDVLSKLKLDPSTFGFRFPTTYLYDVACTYQNQPGDWDPVAGGQMLIFPTAL